MGGFTGLLLLLFVTSFSSDSSFFPLSRLLFSPLVLELSLSASLHCLDLVFSKDSYVSVWDLLVFRFDEGDAGRSD